MSNKLWKSLLVNPAVLSATLTVSAAIGATGIANAADAPKATAQTSNLVADAAPSVASLDQIKAYGTEGVAANDAGQVTSVSQLSDVRPTDWAFQALQSLVERYGCIAGYPDRTYRGNRALTRYEFAAGLNACLNRVNELIAAATADLVKKEDLATLQKLQEQFAAELATLRGRVDALETRTTTLEKQQFSTTTKLSGEAIIAVSGALGENKAVPSGAAPSTASVDENTTLSNRVRLSLKTSFTGKDTLLTRLQARNITDFAAATGTNMARLSFEGSGSSGNQVALDKLYYRFPVGPASVTVDAIGGEFYNNIPNFNPLLASDGQGSISRFGRFNPIYRQGSVAQTSGAGATVNFPLSSAITLSAGYLATTANDPTAGNGLLNGSYGAIGQIAFKPSSNIDLGLTYARTYRRGGDNLSGGTGSSLANSPFGPVPTTADQFGAEATIRLSPKLVLSGWGGYTKAHQSNGSTNEAELWNWAASVAFPDLGGKGNLAGVIVGVPPKVTSNDAPGTSRDRNTSIHLEGLYRFQFSDKVSITPGIIVIFNPEHNNANDTEYVGTVRTTFTF